MGCGFAKHGAASRMNAFGFRIAAVLCFLAVGIYFAARPSDPCSGRFLDCVPVSP
jgi:hypothetical protein